MSDNRKYYYLKLKENYFDDDSIVLLESMQDGVLYSNILLKLYLKSLKHGGRLQLDEDIPYTAQMIATITAAGHDYILGGNVLACSVKSEQKDGKTMYSCVLNYSVTVTEVATSTTVASATFDHSPSGIGGTVGKLLDLSDSKDKAIASAVNMIASDIENFLIKEFPLESTIVPMDYEVKKDKLVKCYINLGSDHGVKKGDYFSVLAPSVRAGRTTYSEIGKMKVDAHFQLYVNYVAYLKAAGQL